jgi:adenylate cyclase
MISKGLEMPLRIYEVGGIAGSYNLALEGETPAQFTLARQIPLRYNLLESKDVGAEKHTGFISRLSKNGAEIILSEPVSILANLKMNLGDVDEKLAAKDFYGKAIKQAEDDEQIYAVRFTSVPPEVDAYLQALRQHAVKPGPD